MKKQQILQKLKIDEDYYGDFGNQFLSNSHVGKLLNDPLNIFKPMKPSPAFLIGGYLKGHSVTYQRVSWIEIDDRNPRNNLRRS